jgi:hypothetical protein
MAVAQGNCPGCGAPIQFGLGASLARVCDMCHSTVLRTDRGLQDLGKVAALADTLSLIAVGDQGTLANRPFEVLGRVQLDYGAGPWDEYYVAFDHGNAWGWLAYAQGRWHATSLVANLQAPPYDELQIDQDYVLPFGTFSVAELRSAKIVSAEGELPGIIRPGAVRYYADAYSPDWVFATFDYDDGTGPSSVYAGQIFPEALMSVTELGPRSINKVKTEQLKCPNCGGDVPKLNPDRSERLGCPYCGAISDIPARTVIAQQEKLLQTPDIPIGKTGALEGYPYLCLAYIRRSTAYEGEPYAWEEYLLFNPEPGYRWLVKDPETGWSFTSFVSLADVDRRQFPEAVRFRNRTFAQRNAGVARVDYVLGEVYWKCSVGETVSVIDFASGDEVLSREEVPGEVNYSYSQPLAWPAIASAFGLPVDGPGGAGIPQGSAGSRAAVGCGTILMIVIVVVVLIILLAVAAASMGGSGGGTVFVGGTSGYRGGGSYSGGK